MNEKDNSQSQSAPARSIPDSIPQQMPVTSVPLARPEPTSMPSDGADVKKGGLR